VWVALSISCNVLFIEINVNHGGASMAIQSIDQNLVIQFQDRLHISAQQNRARLRPYVQIKQMKGDNFAYDGLGPVEATEVVGRVQEVTFNDIIHNRRKIKRQRFVVTLPLDSSDIRGMLLDPESDYANACTMAMERVFDRVVVAAMFADVLTGRDFETTVTAANDGVVTVDATAGLTYEKLLEINQNFTDADVGNDLPETTVLGLAGKEMTALMSEIELTSGDYTRQFAVEKGELVRALGMGLVKYAGSVNNPILPVSAGTRDCFAMSTRAMCVGMSADVKLKIAEREDLVETTQVQTIIELGAVRTEGVLIQKVQTTA
jgi:hypothetical protein